MLQLTCYVAIGAGATAVHFALLVAMVEKMGVPSFAAAGIGATFGAQVSFIGNRWFTFAHRGRVSRSWPKFQTTALLGAVLSMVVVAIAVQLRLHYLIGQVTASIASLLITFVINRRWAFGD